MSFSKEAIRKLQTIGVFVVLGVFIPIVSWAHPHAFVITSYKMVFDHEGLAGFYVNWVFDEMYSTIIGSEFDLDGNGIFSEAESSELVKLGNESLSDFTYFTHIKIDGTPSHIRIVEKFNIRYKDGILYYEFFVNCRVKAGKEKHRIDVAPYDDEYFIAMFFPDRGAVLLENSEEFNIETTIGEDPDTLIYFDQLHPMILSLEFQRQK